MKQSSKKAFPVLTSFLIIAILIGFCLLVAASCKKGDTGPAGQTGPTGPTGATGSPNVIYSAWVMANASRDTTMDNSALKVATVAAPQIVDSILAKGTVILYFTYGGGVYILPYTSNAGGKPNTISFIPALGKIFVTRFTHDNSNSIVLSSVLQYRYIIIPGGVAGRRITVDYTTMTYEQVCNYLNIPQ